MAIIKRNKSTIFGLNDTLASLAADISAETAAREAATGDLTTLVTTDKSSLVKAINEAYSSSGDLADQVLIKSENLADVDATVARTNLDVLSSDEVTEAIEEAKLALGTNFTVADIAERDLLENLDNADRVFVRDGGEGTWAQYKPVAFDETTGLVTEWQTLTTQAALEAAQSSQAIKEAYESNDDTNAYTDAEKEKVGHISVTRDIDLDEALLRDDILEDMESEVPTHDKVPSVLAVRQFTTAAISESASTHMLEGVVVDGDLISLTYQPKNGLASILNFGTVRYTDEHGSAYDAPVLPTANAGEFLVQADSEGQWDGNTVMVQYVHNGVLTVASEGMSGDEPGEEDEFVDQGELPDPEGEG